MVDANIKAFVDTRLLLGRLHPKMVSHTMTAFNGKVVSNEHQKIAVGHGGQSNGDWAWRQALSAFYQHFSIRGRRGYTYT